MKYKINKNLILQKLDNKLVGFDVDRSFLYTFNETAEYIFKKIKGGWEVDRIAIQLQKKYEISLAQVKKDVNSLIKDLLNNSIIIKK